MSRATKCPRCGAHGEGKFCSECGGPLASSGGCNGCGTPLKQGALYCSECGAAVGAPVRKPTSAHLPWILSGLALAAFSVVIALLVQGESVTRTGDMTMTGGLPGEAGAAAGMPSMEELASMSPREAADRLFERAMTEHAGGDYERFVFFADMGLQAYDAVPPTDTDADLRFHIGMLRLLLGDSIGARTSSEEILSEDSEHLLGLLLGARTADFAGDAEAGEAMRRQMRDIVDANGGIPDRPEYNGHRPMIEPMLEGGGP